MDLTIISEILKQLLPFHSKISLPGIGSFIVEEISSEITNKGTLITPPLKILKFSFALRDNDGLMEREYSKITNQTTQEARLSIEKLVKEIRIQLTENRKIKIPSLGEFKFNENGELLFLTADSALIFSPITIPSEINIVPKDLEEIIPDTSSFDLACSDTSDLDVKTERDSNDETLENSEISLENENISQDEDGTSNALTKLTEKEYLYEKSHQQTEEKIEEGNTQEEIKERSQEKFEEGQKDKQKENVIHKIEEKSLLKYKWMIIILFVVIILLLLVTILFVFQDQFKPLFEYLLYNKEERILLKYF